MQLPVNPFKAALRAKQPQIGLWVGLADAYATEVLATAGFDWLVLDGEHAPNNVPTILPQLQAAAPYPSHCIVRPVIGDVAMIKQYLDIGVQTVLVPMVDTAEEAALMVQATRYPPQGIRGVGSALTRSSRWNLIGDYLHTANDEMCVLVQAETVEAMTNLADIAAVEGVDGLFIGPADLSASMGYLGRPDAPEVQAEIARAFEVILAAGKAPGILTTDVAQARQYLDMGALFVAVGVDALLLAYAARNLAAAFKSPSAPVAAPAPGSAY